MDGLSLMSLFDYEPMFEFESCVLKMMTQELYLRTFALSALGCREEKEEFSTDLAICLVSAHV